MTKEKMNYHHLYWVVVLLLCFIEDKLHRLVDRYWCKTRDFK